MFQVYLARAVSTYLSKMIFQASLAPSKNIIFTHDFDRKYDR
jgi:hypothetical protein